MTRIKREAVFVHNLVHHNPGLAQYDSAYNDPKFLKERGYDGQTFDLFHCAQYGLLWDGVAEKYRKASVFLEGSEAREWVLRRKNELKKSYTEATRAGLTVSFMMDVIVLPKAILSMFPEILNEEGQIDIALPMTKALIEDMFEEMFTEFPEITGIYIRFGETYTGERYGAPYHCGSNPILKADSVEYHFLLIRYLQEIVCEKYQREIYYRTWGIWGEGDFQHNPDTYLRISNQIPVHPKFYFCVKHTSGDFHRCSVFNQTLNVGKHKQIVEVQAAREYEGKGAYPNYIAGGVINGFEEFKWLMPNAKKRCLRDVMNTRESKIKGLWTWARGGGWDGPYINGKNGANGEVVIKDGSELWCDVNAYVLACWAKNPRKSDKAYVLRYAREILQTSRADSRLFYEICVLSARAVLLGRGRNTDEYTWDVWWTRDQNINPQIFLRNIRSVLDASAEEKFLLEREESVSIWKRIVELSNTLTTGTQREFIKATCLYGYYLYSIYEITFRANIFAIKGFEIQKLKEKYEELWAKWRALKEKSPCCPTLYAKENVNQRLIGYEGNRGLDSVMNDEWFASLA